MSPTASPADDVLALDQRRWHAMTTNDLDTLDDLLHPALVYTHSNALVDTKDSYLASLRDGVVRYVSVTHTDTAVTLSGSAAVITGRATFAVHAMGRDLDLDSRYTAVWVEEDGAWRFLAWQSTPMSQ